MTLRRRLQRAWAAFRAPEDAQGAPLDEFTERRRTAEWHAELTPDVEKRAALYKTAELRVLVDDLELEIRAIGQEVKATQRARLG